MKEYENDVKEFLRQSNYIESEYSEEALQDAIFAWDYFINCTFRLEDVLHCHYLIMRNIDSNIAGKIREQNVNVGGCLKPFISTQLIKDDLKYLCVRINQNKVEPKEAHIQFEYIHPFLDGNGRVGRMLYNAHRIKLGLPIHIIKESEKKEYYEWF